ncbi:MAG: neutral/alkaline non-lysosomal ceramidase N-terminal domain-containing protein [Pirellulales bacterium]
MTNPHLVVAAASVAALCTGAARVAADDATQWKAGVAAVAITPDRPMWMAGYAARDKPAEGTVQDLYAKALALEDGRGTRLVIVTMDLIGVPRLLRDRLEAAAEEQFGLPAAALLVNASHTHCGPELRADKAALYGLGETRARQAREYLAALEKKLARLIGEALDSMAPARLAYTHARAGFAMNRRLITERGVLNRPNPDGPVDHDVPVLAVEAPDGKLRAVLFGYACHNTTLSFYQFCGDYAGYAQQFVEEAHPGTTALFLAGCGGDQNPQPRRTLELAKQHGRALANAVEAALLAPAVRPITGPLRAALEEVTLHFAAAPAREELLEWRDSDDRIARRRGELLLEELEANGSLRTTYPYPVQVVQFGDELTLVALAGEVVVDYSLRLKRELGGPAVWVAGYSNDVFGYLASRRVLEEGGYEGGGAMRYTLLPGPFAPSVERRVIAKVHELVWRVRSQGGETEPAASASPSQRR